MTPKEKAEELHHKMYMVDDPMGNYPMCFDTAKQCALIAVDTVLWMASHYATIEYWQEVRKEIEAL